MKPRSFVLAIVATLALTRFASSAAAGEPASVAPALANATPQYTADGKLMFPERYRTWVFLSSGLDMSYLKSVGSGGHSMFDNVFVDPDAYEAFLRTGTWPDGTMLVLEVRGASQKGSINRHGRFQTEDVMGVEVHLKDTKRFPRGWAFFAFRGQAPAAAIPTSADCYACHEAHGAVDTTFVQFYPTLREVATHKGTFAAAK